MHLRPDGELHPTAVLEGGLERHWCMLTTNSFAMYTGPSRSTGVLRSVALRTVRAYHWQCEEAVHQLSLDILLSLPAAPPAQKSKRRPLPELGPCAASGRAWRLRAAWHPQE